MPGNSSLFKPWPEHGTKSSLFKPSVTQPISQITYDLKSELLVRYSSLVLNKELLVRYSSQTLIMNHSRSEMFGTIQIPTSSLFRSPLYYYYPLLNWCFSTFPFLLVEMMLHFFNIHRWVFCLLFPGVQVPNIIILIIQTCFHLFFFNL